MLKWILISAGGLAALVALLAVAGLFIPKGHRAERTVTVDAPPERVFALISDVAGYPTWRPDVKHVEVLPDSNGIMRFRETGPHGVVPYRVERNEPPARWVTRIDDPSLPYGGTWTFALTPEGAATSLTITEDGEIYNPIFRVLSRTVFSTTATIEAYQAALRQHLESAVGR